MINSFFIGEPGINLKPLEYMLEFRNLKLLIQ